MGIDKDAMIARQALEIESLKDQNRELKDSISAARNRIVCIGGPLNDNVRGYSSDQLREWQAVLNDLEWAREHD